MTDAEIQAFCTLKNYTSFAREDMKYFCNNVPREVEIFENHQDCEVYLTRRSHELYESVAIKVLYLEDSKKRYVSRMLDSLICDHTFAILDHTIPLFETGLVYRSEADGHLRTLPTCHPAEKALFQLWKSLGQTHLKSVPECTDTSDSHDLERRVVC